MRKTKSLLRWVIIKAPVTGQKTAFEEISCDVRERDLLIAVSERQNTSVSPTIYPELSGTLVIISHIPV